MRSFAAAQSAVAPEMIVRMATQHGAQALGWEKRIGGIFEQALADMIAIPFRGKPDDAWSALVHHTGPVSASMINGKWAQGEFASKPESCS
jgi:cytosine/adenosine deaminase-related metal-dependent hydrolase